MLLCAAERTLQINLSFFLLCFHFVFCGALGFTVKYVFIYLYIYIIFIFLFGATDILQFFFKKKLSKLLHLAAREKLFQQWQPNNAQRLCMVRHMVLGFCGHALAVFCILPDAKLFVGSLQKGFL